MSAAGESNPPMSTDAGVEGGKKTKAVKAPKVVEEPPTCPVCIAPFTGTLRRPIHCSSCGGDTCAKCVEAYLLNIVDDPHCPHCKAQWNRAFLATACTKTYMQNAYMKKRQTLLFERERSFFPQYQTVAERELRAREAERERTILESKTWALRTEVGKRMMEIREEMDRECERIRKTLYKEVYAEEARVERLNRRIERIRAGEDEKGEGEGADAEGAEGAEGGAGAGAGAKSKREVAKFVRRCMADGCNGFLSSVWKCGLCSNWVCPDCFEVKGIHKDAEHTCKPDMLETAKLIKKDTKPCPECGEVIQKTSGCFAENTPILGWDGRVIMSQDIRVGDVLIGDDGTPREVTATVTGEDELYEVKQSSGMPYIVNSKHTLVLKMISDRSIQWMDSIQGWKMKWFDHTLKTIKCKTIRASGSVTKDDAYTQMYALRETITFPTTIEILVEDYIKLPPASKCCLVGFKTEGADWPHKDVALDPYLLGLYVGDGINDGMSFAACPEKDPEIIHYLLEWCDSHGAELCHDAAYRFRIRSSGSTHSRAAITRGAASSTCKGCTFKKCDLCDLPTADKSEPVEYARLNPYTQALKQYSLVHNKHIPADFIVNDRHTRLQVLAGLIDTDGYVSATGKRVMISQSNWEIGRMIELLARSLGFVVNTRTLAKNGITFPGVDAKDYPAHFAINISGTKLSEIPTCIVRKKCVDAAPNKNWLHSSIEVTPIGRGTYYGWSVCSPIPGMGEQALPPRLWTGGSVTGNKRFVLQDFTCLRNCDQMWCISCHTPFSWETGKKVTSGIIHNPHYFQWMAQGGRGVPQNPGHIPCGGLPDVPYLQRILTGTARQKQRHLMEILRCCMHIQDVERNRYSFHTHPPNNEDLGVRFLMKDLGEDGYKAALARQETERLKSAEIRAALDAFLGASIDLFRRFDTERVYGRTEGEALIEEVTKELDALRLFIGDAFLAIGRSFNCSVPYIHEGWHIDHGKPPAILKAQRELAAERVLRRQEEALAVIQRNETKAEYKRITGLQQDALREKQTLEATLLLLENDVRAHTIAGETVPLEVTAEMRRQKANLKDATALTVTLNEAALAAHRLLDENELRLQRLRG